MARYQDGYKKYWQISSSSLSKKYQLFAELFAVSGYHNLSACFYAISLGYVPKEVFKQAFPNAKWQCYIYGRFLIYREVTPLERLGITLAQNALPIFIFLLVISLLTTLTILSKNILIPAMNSYFAFTDFKQSGYRSLQKMISNLQGTTGIKDQAIVHQVIKEVFKKSDLEFKASEKKS